MNPGDAAGDVGIFDAMTCLRVVFHNFARAATAEFVDLEEGGGAGAGDADAVFLDEGLNHQRVDDGLEEGDEVGVLVEADAAVHDVVRDETRDEISPLASLGRNDRKKEIPGQARNDTNQAPVYTPDGRRRIALECSDSRSWIRAACLWLHRNRG